MAVLRRGPRRGRPDLGHGLDAAQLPQWRRDGHVVVRVRAVQVPPHDGPHGVHVFVRRHGPEGVQQLVGVCTGTERRGHGLAFRGGGGGDGSLGSSA